MPFNPNRPLPNKGVQGKEGSGFIEAATLFPPSKERKLSLEIIQTIISEYSLQQNNKIVMTLASEHK